MCNLNRYVRENAWSHTHTEAGSRSAVVGNPCVAVMQSSHSECSGFNPALQSVLPLPGTQTQPRKPAGLALKSDCMPTAAQLLGIILYNNNMALGLSYLSLCVQKSGCFYPQRRMLLAMSGLNQNNKSHSRLAIISEHVAADKRKQFWSRLG